MASLLRIILFASATLHVPASALEQYQNAYPWWYFGTIVALTDEDAVAEVKAMPVMIQTQGSTIAVQRADKGTNVSVYSVNGMLQGSAIADEGIAILNTSLQSGSVAVVKIGEKSVKVLMK